MCNGAPGSALTQACSPSGERSSAKAAGDGKWDSVSRSADSLPFGPVIIPIGFGSKDYSASPLGTWRLHRISTRSHSLTNPQNLNQDGPRCCRFQRMLSQADTQLCEHHQPRAVLWGPQVSHLAFSYRSRPQRIVWQLPSSPGRFRYCKGSKVRSQTTSQAVAAHGPRQS